MNWSATYPNTVVMPLGKPVSDHVPCYVSIESAIPKSKFFRFEEYWIGHTGFFETVQQTWNKRCNAPNSAAVLCKKLKNLRYSLKHWSKGISRLSSLIDNSNKAIFELDGIEEQRALTVPEANFRIILKKHLITLLNYKKLYWKK